MRAREFGRPEHITFPLLNLGFLPVGQVITRLGASDSEFAIQTLVSSDTFGRRVGTGADRAHACRALSFQFRPLSCGFSRIRPANSSSVQPLRKTLSFKIHDHMKGG